jgi:hypothetical protein
MKSPGVWTVAVVMALTLFESACSSDHDAPTYTLHRAGTVTFEVLDEISGLAPSRRESDQLWAHNDSGGEPVLYALGTDGSFRGAVRLQGVKSVDWEDLDSFEMDGQSWLLVADTGDNNLVRKNCAIHIIAEPDPSQLSPQKEISVPIAWTVPVRYPDAPRDCEAVAVDVQERKIYLLVKRRNPAELFTLPLRPPQGSTPVAQQVATVTHLPQPTAEQSLVPVPTGRYRAQPTAMDFSPDRKFAVVLTYGDVALFPRRVGETWAQTLARKPILLPPHELGQAEAATFGRDQRTIFVSGEQKQAPLLRYDASP